MKRHILALIAVITFGPTLSLADTKEQQIRLQQLREINDQALNQYLTAGMDPNKQRNVAFVLSSPDQQKLKTLREKLLEKGQKVGKVWVLKKDEKGTHHILEIIYKHTLADKAKLLTYSQLIDEIAKENDVQFIGWAAGK